MSTVPKSVLAQGALTTYNALFLSTLLKQPSDLMSMAMVRDSTNDTESYNWLGLLDGLREWIGPREVKALAAYSFTLKNKKYEKTVAIPREAVEDDQLDQYGDVIRQIAVQTALHPEKQLIDLLNAGFATACYDGQFFFDTDHSEGDSGTQSNKGTSALDRTTLIAALTAMEQRKGDSGDYLGVVATHLTVGPELKWTALELLESTEIIAAGNTDVIRGNANVLKNQLTLRVHPRVNSNNWYLTDESKFLKPFVWQWRVKPQFSGITNPEADSVFDTDEYKYGVRGRWNAGYALWQLAYGADVA